jgi:SAM-dependent methyltransferase
VKKRVYDRWRRVIDPLLTVRLSPVRRWAMDKVYDQDFFLDANQEKQRSAATVARILSELYHFESVFDIGCGCGLYLAELQRLGKEAVGCDGSSYGVRLAPPEIIVFQADVTRPIALNRRFDVVVCFEVAEHLQSRFSRRLVENCTTFSDRVLFTAAPPGQGGVGHLNERPFRFWIELFAERGFAHEEHLSRRVRERMTEAHVVEWIANNFMSFTRLEQHA